MRIRRLITIATFVLLAQNSFAQIQTFNPANGSITITPEGINGKNSNPSQITNTALGSNALSSIVNGANNTAIGYLALSSPLSGGYNVATGTEALKLNNLGYQNTATGGWALRINTNGNNNVANGTCSLCSNTSGSHNTAVGTSTLRYNTTGNYNVAIGVSAGFSIIQGSNNIAIGSDAQVADGNQNNQVRIGNNSIYRADIQVPWTITSDQRWKSDIRDTKLGLNFISQLRPVSYYRTNSNEQKAELGLIAQEVDNVLKQIGTEDLGLLQKDDKGFYSLRYNDLLAPIIKAIQEQQTIIEKQQQTIDLLVSKLETLLNQKTP